MTTRQGVFTNDILIDGGSRHGDYGGGSDAGGVDAGGGGFDAGGTDAGGF